jgi:glycerol-3-phosphate dehydrogenase
MTSFDIIALGAGVAGIAVARAARKAGCTCVLIDVQPFKGFASVRNQGWLHSGALYAVGDYAKAGELVETCKRGSQRIIEIDRELGLGALSSTPGLMVGTNTRRTHRGAVTADAACGTVFVVDLNCPKKDSNRDSL